MKKTKWENHPETTLSEWIKSAEDAVQFWDKQEKEARQNKKLMTNRLGVLKALEEEVNRLKENK